MRVAILGSLLLLVLTACGKDPYIDLEIADAELPFLVPVKDYDQLSIETQAEGCTDTDTRYEAVVLPVTLTVVPGACTRGKFELRAAALMSGARVASSRWIPAEFPEHGARVLTATLADL